jgi:rapamycin-insensitive companion of mTOR
MQKIHFGLSVSKLWPKLVGLRLHEDDLYLIVFRAALIDIDLVARTGGIRFLLHALGEGPVEMGPLLAATFLYIVDSPRTRAYLRVGGDLEVRPGFHFENSSLHLATRLQIALSAVTDAYGKGPDHTERIRGCARVIQSMLRTWSGAFIPSFVTLMKT